MSRLIELLNLRHKIHELEASVQLPHDIECMVTDGGRFQVETPFLPREELVVGLVALLAELGCGEEEFFCKRHDYLNKGK